MSACWSRVKCPRKSAHAHINTLNLTVVFVNPVHSPAMHQGDLKSVAMSALRQRVGECIAGETGGAAGRCLASHALGTLRRLAAQPGTKAVARVFETPHPYQNRMVSERAASWNALRLRDPVPLSIAMQEIGVFPTTT